MVWPGYRAPELPSALTLITLHALPLNMSPCDEMTQGDMRHLHVYLPSACQKTLAALCTLREHAATIWAGLGGIMLYEQPMLLTAICACSDPQRKP